MPGYTPPVSWRARIRPHSLPLAAILAAWCALFLPSFTGKVFFPGHDFLAATPPWDRVLSPSGCPPLPFADGPRALYPDVLFTAREWNAGRFPLWNPLVHCGSPHWTSPNAQVLNPLYLPFFLVPSPRVYGGILILAHLALALLAYAWFFEVSRSRVAALAATLALAGAPWTLFWLFAGQPLIQTWLWFPAVLLCFRRASGGAPWRWIACGGAAVAGAVAAGHLQVLAFIAVSLAMHAAGAALVEGRAVRRAAIAATMLVTGILAAGILLVPLGFDLARSYRLAEAAAEHLRPWQAAASFLPGIFGDVLSDAHWLPSAPAAYAGAVCLAALLAAARRPGPWRLWRWDLVFPLAGAVLLVYATPVARLAEAFLPGWAAVKRFYKMDGFILFWTLSLGAAAVPRLLEEGSAGTRRLGRAMLGLGLAGVAVQSALFAAAALRPESLRAAATRAAAPLIEGSARLHAPDLYPDEERALRAHYARMTSGIPEAWRRAFSPRNPRAWAPVFVALAAGACLLAASRRRDAARWAGGILVLAAAADGLTHAGPVWRQHAERDRIFPPVPGLAGLADGRVLPVPPPSGELAPPATLAPYGLAVPDGFSPTNTASKMRLVGHLNDPGSEFRGWGIFRNTVLRNPVRPAIDLFGVRRLVTVPGTPPPAEGLDPVSRGRDLDVYANPEAFPLAAWVPTARSGSDTDAREALAGKRPFDPRRVLWISGPLSGPDREDPPRAPGRVDETGRTPSSWRGTCDFPEGGWLHLSIAHDPGWRARVEGRSVPIRRANAILQAVELPPGVSRVELDYHPCGWGWGIAASAAGVALLVLLARAGRRGGVMSSGTSP